MTLPRANKNNKTTKTVSIHQLLSSRYPKSNDIILLPNPSETFHFIIKQRGSPLALADIQGAFNTLFIRLPRKKSLNGINFSHEASSLCFFPEIHVKSAVDQSSNSPLMISHDAICLICFQLRLMKKAYK